MLLANAVYVCASRILGRETRFSSVPCLVEIDYQLDLKKCQLLFENNSHLGFWCAILLVHIVFLPLEHKTNREDGLWYMLRKNLMFK